MDNVFAAIEAVDIEITQVHWRSSRAAALICRSCRVAIFLQILCPCRHTVRTASICYLASGLLCQPAIIVREVGITYISVEFYVGRTSLSRARNSSNRLGLIVGICYRSTPRTHITGLVDRPHLDSYFALLARTWRMITPCLRTAN